MIKKLKKERIKKVKITDVVEMITTTHNDLRLSDLDSLIAAKKIGKGRK